MFCGCPPGGFGSRRRRGCRRPASVDRQRLPVRLQRLVRLAGMPLQNADVVVGARQVAPEVGDGGVVIGQLLLDRQRRR